MSRIDPVRQAAALGGWAGLGGDFAKLWAGGLAAGLVGHFDRAAADRRAGTPRLGAASALLFGLTLGALVDRVRRRPVLIATDLARAAIAGSLVFGLLGELVGLRPSLIDSGVGTGLGILWLLRSPLA